MWGVRFTADQRLKIEAFSDAHAITRADAIRRLVDKGLEADQ